MKRYCEYHSLEWEGLVETGWITWVVDENEQGVRIATMIYNQSRGLT